MQRRVKDAINPRVGRQLERGVENDMKDGIGERVEAEWWDAQIAPSDNQHHFARKPEY